MCTPARGALHLSCLCVDGMHQVPIGVGVGRGRAIYLAVRQQGQSGLRACLQMNSAELKSQFSSVIKK